MKIAKFAPIVGFVVVLMLGGITFGKDAAKTAAEVVEKAPVKISAAGGTTEAAKAPATPAAAEDEICEKKSEADEKTEECKDQQQSKGPLGNKYFFPIMIGGFIVLWVFMGRGKKKQAAKRKELLASLKKGDRVMTIGGIIGTVAEAREQELIVKVDDGTRMKFARWAIRNAGEEVTEEKQKDEQEK